MKKKLVYKKKLYICIIINPQKHNNMGQKNMSASESYHNSDTKPSVCENCLLHGCEDTYPNIYKECNLRRGIIPNYSSRKLSSNRFTVDWSPFEGFHLKVELDEK